MRGRFAARSLLAHVREYFGDRRRWPRRGARFVARVTALVALLEVGSGYAAEAPEHLRWRVRRGTSALRG